MNSDELLLSVVRLMKSSDREMAESPITMADLFIKSEDASERSAISDSTQAGERLMKSDCMSPSGFSTERLIKSGSGDFKAGKAEERLAARETARKIDRSCILSGKWWWMSFEGF